ncbi:hypothetical protein KPH14_003333 [Odynerus spinipes]|uniref:Uncharacterized protein n=1 Tax=Odynerus spinipes TaxID=1348599 RepID=A0AAD9RDT5_9HYME|nr:hypothetical protein KPH14_003333 [Odynerus spinipes]
MRDTSDMTEDVLSEDTMMDCGGDGGALEDFVELATDIADSSRTIRDAAERLLTLLGVDDENDDILSSSEDEGVEVDVDDEEDEEQPENTRLLHQLAASLAQELKYSQQKHDPGPTRIFQGRGSFDERDQNVEMVQDTSFHGQSCFRNQIEVKTTSDNQFHGDPFNEDQFSRERRYSFGYSSYQSRPDDLTAFESKESLKTSSVVYPDHRRHHNHHHHHHHRQAHHQPYHHHHHHNHRSRMNDGQEERSMVLHRDHLPGSWGSGWDACATEALRYLVEDEGLPPHHPTVLAMKNHLELQRGRVFAHEAQKRTRRGEGTQGVGTLRTRAAKPADALGFGLLQLLLDRASGIKLRLEFPRLLAGRRPDDLDLSKGGRQRRGSFESIKMLPEGEGSQHIPTATAKGVDNYKSPNVPQKKEQNSPLRAWKRLEWLVTTFQTNGQKCDKHTAIEATFRGDDLFYASHIQPEQSPMPPYVRQETEPCNCCSVIKYARNC